MFKNMKMKTKLIIGFLVPIAITILNIIISNLTTKRAAAIVEVSAQERYVKISGFVMLGFAVVSVLITAWIASLLIKIIEKSVKQLSDAADRKSTRLNSSHQD